LKVESGQGFLRLFPGAHRLHGVAREMARGMAQGFYRMQLWTSYQVMARCFGALMLVLWRDLSDDEYLQPSPLQKQLFSQLHRPQFYLGGLPLAFFSRPQLGWVIAPLLELWGQELLDPEAYDALNTLLGIYGETASLRRQVDRDSKAELR